MKRSVIARMDTAVKLVDNPVPAPMLKLDEEELTDIEYAERRDRAAEQVDAEWWSIPAHKRPPFSIFAKQRGFA